MPPPPNTAKPLPQPNPSGVASSVSGSNSNHTSNHIGATQTPSSSNRQNFPSAIPTAADRKYNADSTPSPPIVVVSPDGGQFDPGHRLGPHNAPGGHSHGLDHSAVPPRATTLNRLRSTPRDTIAIVGKPPRKQRSSRFVVTEKIEIERLPLFMGAFSTVAIIHDRFLTFEFLKESPPTERTHLFIRKLQQCRVLFDFNDASTELKGKQIKTQTLHEMLEYITHHTGVITSSVYPEVVIMVCGHLKVMQASL